MKYSYLSALFEVGARPTVGQVIYSSLAAILALRA
jgi:hypothetical protein